MQTQPHLRNTAAIDIVNPLYYRLYANKGISVLHPAFPEAGLPCRTAKSKLTVRQYGALDTLAISLLYLSMFSLAILKSICNQVLPRIAQYEGLRSFGSKSSAMWQAYALKRVPVDNFFAPSGGWSSPARHLLIYIAPLNRLILFCQSEYTQPSQSLLCGHGLLFCRLLRVWKHPKLPSSCCRSRI